MCGRLSLADFHSVRIIVLTLSVTNDSIFVEKYGTGDLSAIRSSPIKRRDITHSSMFVPFAPFLIHIARWHHASSVYPLLALSGPNEPSNLVVPFFYFNRTFTVFLGTNTALSI